MTSTVSSKGILSVAQAGFASTPEQFGAVGDGYTDDTVALQACLDARVPLVLRPGSTYVSSTLNLQTGATIFGMFGGGYVQGVQTAPPNSMTSRIKLAGGATGPLFQAVTEVSHVHMRDFEIDGNRANQTSEKNLINLDDSTGVPREAQWRLHNLYIHDHRGTALYVGLYRLNVALYECVVENTYSIPSMPALLVKGDDFNFVGGLIGETHNTEALAIYATTFRIISSEFFVSDYAGLHLAGNDGTVIGCTIDKSQREGIYIDSNVRNVDISSTTLHSNSLATNGGYSHISVASGSQISLSNIKFGPTDSSAGTTNKPQYGVNIPDVSTRVYASNISMPSGAVTGDVASRAFSTWAITQTAAPGAGGGGALPLTPAGYYKQNINGVDRFIAYY